MYIKYVVESCKRRLSYKWIVGGSGIKGWQLDFRKHRKMFVRLVCSCRAEPSAGVIRLDRGGRQTFVTRAFLCRDISDFGL